MQASVEKGQYREASNVHAELVASVFFWNALFYNEPDSQIAMDAGSLKVSSTVSVLRYYYITYHFLHLTRIY